MSTWFFYLPLPITKPISFQKEVVLSVLLSTFKFSLSEKQVGWTMNGIAAPYVKGADKTRPQLPMVMTTLEKPL